MERQCTLCDICAGKEPARIVWENDLFLSIWNKPPQAPIHVLVFPKNHTEKNSVCADIKGFHEGMMAAVYQVVRFLGLETKGYKLINNGAGYNHIEHEHWHVISGLEEKQE